MEKAAKNPQLNVRPSHSVLSLWELSQIPSSAKQSYCSPPGIALTLPVYLDDVMDGQVHKGSQRRQPGGGILRAQTIPTSALDDYARQHIGVYM